MALLNEPFPGATLGSTRVDTEEIRDLDAIRNRIGHAVDYAESIAQMLEVICYRLVGPLPEGEEAIQKDPSACNVVQELNQRCGDLMASLGSVEDLARRLHRL